MSATGHASVSVDGRKYYCFSVSPNTAHRDGHSVVAGAEVVSLHNIDKRPDARAVYICYCLVAVNGTARCFLVCSLIEIE